MLVTIAMIAYDEAPNVKAVSAEALAALTAGSIDGEVLLVDDGSRDGTSEIADSIALREPRFRVLHHGANRGFSGAMSSALRQSRGEWIFLVPADGQVPLHDVGRFLAASAGADIVVGIRSHRPERVGRLLLSRAFHRIAKTLFPLPLEEFSSAFFFRRAILDAMPIRSRPRSAAILPEVLFRAHSRGARFVQLRFEARARQGGTAKGARPSLALLTLLELMRLAPLVRFDEFRHARRTRAAPVAGR
jgi:glycosyltransferase involved in cell wall biosynthesis